MTCPYIKKFQLEKKLKSISIYDSQSLRYGEHEIQ
jgi:hypothetical protein